MLKVDAVLRVFKKTIKKNSEAVTYNSFSPKIRYNLCCTRILQRNFSDWSGWKHRDEWAEAMADGIKTIPFWRGENVKNLVIIGEQGIGDEILFASVIPEAMVRCENVTYCCDERLVIPLARSLPGLHTKTRYVDAREDLIGGYDAFIPAADLMALFRLRPEHFARRPFLRVNQDRVAEFKRYEGRIGLSWSGRHGYIDPLELGIDNPISLQYNESHPSVEIPFNADGTQLDLRNDIEGIIALCYVLSKVVTVPTSVWHFSAAVGTATEVIITPPASERDIDGIVDQLDWHCPIGNSPWYAKSIVYKNIKEWKRR